MDWLLRTSWQITALIAVVLVLQFGLRRWLTPNMRYALWFLVLLRLCMPALPESSMALVPWSGAQATVPSDVASVPGSVDAWARTRMGSSTSMARPPRTIVGESDEAQALGERAGKPNPESPVRANRDTAPRPKSADVPLASTSIWKRTSTWLVGIWVLGALITLARAISGEVAFRRLHSGSEPVEDARVRGILNEAAGHLGVAARPEIHVSEHLRSPALHGLVRPRLWMPRNALERMDDDSLRHVLLHELAHYKHRDLWTAALLLPITALWWFHPVVRLAIARMRVDQEAARDHEVLSVASSPAPLAYARTLIALLEDDRHGPPSLSVPQAAFLIGGHDLRRRIEMITEFRRPKRAHRVLGVGLFGAVAWATLVNAGSHEALPSSFERIANPSSNAIQVERPEPIPAWVSALNLKLDRPLNASFQDMPLSEALIWFRDATDVDLVVDPECSGYEDPELDFTVSDTTARQVLNLMCEMSGFAHWTLHREAIYVGPKGELSMSTSLAFYKVTPLLDFGPDKHRERRLDDLAMLVQEYTGAPHDSWDYAGVIMEPWNDLLMVRHNEATHVQIEAFLNRLLNRGSEPARSASPWETRLAEAMQQTKTLVCEEERIDDVLSALSTGTGVPILIDPEVLEEIHADDLTISLHLKDKSLRVILDWIEEVTEATVTMRNGAIMLTRWPDMRLEFYDVRDLIESQPEDVDVEDMIEELIRHNVAVESWDMDPRCSIRPTHGMVLVNQTPVIHTEVSNLIESLRRALKR
tara:strand:+ start:4723 stop:7002 length:2280 start_codon:yes stop_codon:yes gene_type:complete